MPGMKDQLGRLSYLAYRDAADGKSLATGVALPLWQDLDPKIQSAWQEAAECVRSHVLDDVVEAVEAAR